VNNQRVTLLVLLYLSAAFDTVNHDAMLRRPEYSFGIQGKALSWFASYLSGRIQRIIINESLSKPFKLECGVPQGSCLGLQLFTLYTSELFEIIACISFSLEVLYNDIHNALCLPPKFCINYCCEILLGGLHIPMYVFV